MIQQLIFCMLACLVLRAYASFSGIKDGILYGRQGADSFSWNEHNIYVIERASVWGILVLGYCLHGYGLLPIAMICINSILGFSFWHNGFYYVTRGKMINTDFPFWYNSSSSTAVIELRWKGRLWMEIFSWVLFISYFLYIWIC